MAKKILVTTDLSANSKAGIRFAIQLASQDKSFLIFYYVVELLKPTRWSEVKYDAYIQQETETAHDQLVRFVRGVYDQSGMKPGKFQCIVQQGTSINRPVIDYAKRIKANFICMSTRGAGTFKKWIGTNASDILTTSPVPVFVIPRAYRKSKISQILYASDLNNVGTELKQVKQFAAPLKAKILVYHYDYLIEIKETKQKLRKIADRFKNAGTKFIFQKLNIEYPLSTHLKKDIRKSKSSLVVLFTKQNRDWFERLFLSSKSAEVAFNTPVPLLVYRKKKG